jgi:hypothetical protein
MSVSATRNRAYAAGLILVVSGFAAVPFLLTKRRTEQGVEPLTRQAKPLVGHQLMCGAYANHGSVDVGADPDWDHAAHMWKGDAKRVREGGGFAPSAEDIQRSRAVLDEQARARGAAAK